MAMANNIASAGDNLATNVMVENDIEEMDNEPYTQSAASHNLYMFPPTLKRDIACFPASPSILSPNVSRTTSSRSV